MITPLNIELTYNADAERADILISGEIDYSNYEHLRKINESILNNSIPFKTLVFNLKNCQMISSNGFGLFYELHDTFIKRGKNIQLKFSNTNNLIMTTVKILKMDDEFEFE